MDTGDLTINKIRRGLKEREFSAEEIIKNFLDKIGSENGELNAYLDIDADGALLSARGVDERIARGEDAGMLAGVPMGIKDAILVEGRPATSGSKILEEYIAAYDATAVRKLKENGAVILGKTNMDEFAMGSSNENSAFRVVLNPHDKTRVPGGSSGGSAAAVASGMTHAALGSDTGGSIRQPSAFSGIVGLKPTYGAVSRYGLIAMASSLDQIGPMAKSIEDAAAIFAAISGKDAMDSTSSMPETGGYGDGFLEKIAEGNANGITIGVPEEYFVDGLENEVAKEIDNVIELFEKGGVKIKKINLPHTKYALSVYYIIMPAEASTNLARFDGIRYGTRGDGKTLADLYEENRGNGFGAETKRRIILGTFVLSAGYYDKYYAKAQKVRTLISADFEEAFKSVDVILSPVTPTLPFKIGEKSADPLQMYLSDVFTIPANLAGLPALSMPVKNRDGKLPVGFQLIGKHWGEEDILRVGRFYENL